MKIWRSYKILSFLLQKKVLDVLTVDDKRFSVQINMYFGVLWTEERLKLPKTSNSSAPVSWLPIDLNFMTHLWVPNVFVYNLAAFETLECLQKLSGLWIVKNKELFYNQVGISIGRYIWFNLRTFHINMQVSS